MFEFCVPRRRSPRNRFQPRGARSAARSPPLLCVPSWNVLKGACCRRHGTGLPGHIHSALCWHCLKCRDLDFGWAGCIRCCARRLVPLNCCQTFCGHESSDSADQTRHKPLTAPRRHQPTSSNPPQSRVPPLENPLRRASMGGLTVYGGLTELATLDLAVTTHRNRPGELVLIRPPSLSSLVRAPTDVVERLRAPPT